MFAIFIVIMTLAALCGIVGSAILGLAKPCWTKTTTMTDAARNSLYAQAVRDGQSRHQAGRSRLEKEWIKTYEDSLQEELRYIKTLHAMHANAIVRAFRKEYCDVLNNAYHKEHCKRVAQLDGIVEELKSLI